MGVDVNTVINIVLVVATIAVVWFAWQTVEEARKATKEESNAVTELKALVTEVQNLVATAQETAASSANSVEAARETVKLSRDAAVMSRLWQQANALDRRRERVERIGELVERLFWSVEPSLRDEVVHPSRWMPMRNHLGQLLVGLKEDLPHCAAILNAAATSSAFESAKLGRQEIDVELAQIHADLDAVLSRTSEVATESWREAHVP
jgi:hypothetical protein